MSDPISTKTASSLDSDIDNLLARGFLYEFMSFILRSPRGRDFKGLLMENRENIQNVISEFDTRKTSSLKLLKTFSAVESFLAESTDEELAQSYEQCFGHVAHGKVPIYEIEYGEEHSHRQPTELSDISAFYTAFGMQMQHQAHERVDHAAVECEFMSLLIYKEVYALENNLNEEAVTCREAAKRFLNEHLGQWLPSFAHRLKEKASRGIYQALGDFILRFILQECEEFGVAPGDQTLPLRALIRDYDTGCVSCMNSGCASEPKEEDD